MRWRLALTVVALCCLLTPAGAHASKLVTIDTPSKFVDAKRANFSAPGPHKLQANVLLPDGYDAEEALPAAAAAPRRRRALGLVGARRSREHQGDREGPRRDHRDARRAPSASTRNWWNGGKRGDPAVGALHLRRAAAARRAPLPDPVRAPLARDRRFLDGRLRHLLPRHPAARLLRLGGSLLRLRLGAAAGERHRAEPLLRRQLPADLRAARRASTRPGTTPSRS